MQDASQLLQNVIHELARTGEVPSSLADRDLDLDQLIDETGIDSLGMSSVLAEIESRTSIELPEDVLDTFTRFRDIVAYLERQK